MKTSYNDIVNSMKNDYYERCGKVLDNDKEKLARVESVASELYNLACYGDFVLKQAFPQTATGKHLDNHAEMRYITRKKPTKASGLLQFYCDEYATSTIKIPKGVICSVKDNPYLQFVTIEEKQIEPYYQKYADVKAQAINCGEIGNALKGTITTMVNPPAGIVRVCNNEDFLGGTDYETDSALRQRILDSYSISPNGYNVQSLESAVLDCDGVTRCLVKAGGFLRVTILVETKNGDISNELSKQINDKLFVGKLAGVVFDIAIARPKKYDLVVEIYKNDEINNKMDEQIKDVIKQAASEIDIEQDVKLGRFVSAISNIDGVKYCDVNSDSAIQNIIYANSRGILKLNNLKVIYYE